MSKLRASPFTPRAKEITDPFPLNGDCVGGPKAKHTHCPQPASQPACRLGPRPRAATTTNHSAQCKERLQRASKGTAFTTEILPVSLGGLWLQAERHQLKLLTLPDPQPPAHQTEECPEATLLSILP